MVKGFLRDWWVLIAVLLVFIAFKIPHLSYPYYWDESWPYATAIRAMYDHGISLSPSAMDGELSRGHPLFFHAIAAAWMKVFGNSHIAMHSFALSISVIFLIAIYEAGTRLFNKRVAVIALLLVASQEVFFIQSSLVLFEMLIAILCFLSLWFYVKGRYVLTAICLTALFYTKESGLIMGFVLGIDAFAGLFNKGTDGRRKVHSLLAVGVPCILIGVFFLLQKHIRGWYIFPYYSEIMEHKWNSIWYKFRMNCISDAFYRNQKYYYFLVLGVLGALAAVKNKKWNYLVVLVPIVFVFYFVDDKRVVRIMPSTPFAALFLLGWCWFIFTFSRKAILKEVYQRRFFILGCYFIMAFLMFSTLNYYTYRYMLAVLVPILFLASVLIDFFISNSYRVLYLPVLSVFGAISTYAYIQNDHFGDTDLGCFDAMDVQQDIVKYMEKHGYYNRNIAVNYYVGAQNLGDPATGFLTTEKVFKNVKWEINASTDIVIFNNIEEDYRYKQVSTDSTFERAHRYQKGKVWNEIYKRR